MPPIGNRQVSDERCAQGWELRKQGKTWAAIADALGYRSVQSAQKAISAWLRRNPPDDVEVVRQAVGDILVDTITRLRDCLIDAQDRGELRNAAELGKAILDGADRYAKLRGAHIIPPTEINVTMSITEAIEDTRRRLLDAVDAEVVDVKEIEP